MANRYYTPEELAGKFICCFPVSSGKHHALDCVRNIETNQPHLYNSIDEAKADQYFDPDNDEVVEAQTYYNRINSIKK